MKTIYDRLNKVYDKTLLDQKDIRKHYRTICDLLEEYQIPHDGKSDDAVIQNEIVYESLLVKRQFEDVFFDTYVKMFDYWYDLNYLERKAQMNVDVERFVKELRHFEADGETIYMPAFAPGFNHLYHTEIVLLDLKQYHKFIRECAKEVQYRRYGAKPFQYGFSSCELLAEADKKRNVHPDTVAGVPDSGTAHAVGYANRSGVPFSRPFIKYTPTWPRSFMPTQQSQRNLIARMKLIPVEALIKNKSLLLIDDSIVRGTQLRETTEFLYSSGAKEVHIRPACPPLLYGCKYLNFSRATSEMELIARRTIQEIEGENRYPNLTAYANPDSAEYHAMLEKIREKLNFTSLRYHRLDDMIESIGMDRCKLCTYCWDGRE